MYLFWYTRFNMCLFHIPCLTYPFVNRLVKFIANLENRNSSKRNKKIDCANVTLEYRRIPLMQYGNGIPGSYNAFVTAIPSFWKSKIDNHYVKSIQIRSFFWSVFSCVRTEWKWYTEYIKWFTWYIKSEKPVH